MRVEIGGVGEEVAGNLPVGPWAGYVRILDSGLNGGVVTPFGCGASASDCHEVYVGGRDMDE